MVARDEALDRLDPIVRALVRRRISQLERRAELLTKHSDSSHRARLAYLLGDHQVIPDPDDVEAVTAQAAQVNPPDSPGRKGPWLSALSIATVLACGSAIWGVRTYLAPQPLQATPAAQLLGADLTRFVVAVSQNDTTLQNELLNRMTGAEATRVLGERPTRELSSFLRSMQALHAGTGSDPKPLLDKFRSSTVAIDKALADAKLPFFIDTETLPLKGWPEPIAQSFYVQRESTATTGDIKVRVVQLWRLDTLNVRRSLLGYARPNTPAAIVLLDQVESNLVRFTLPAAAAGGTLELVDDNTRRSEPWAREVEQQASRVLGSYYKSLGVLSEPAAELGRLLGRRKELLSKWEASLRGQGFELNSPKGLFADAELTNALGLRVPRADRDEWDAIEDALRGQLPTFEALRDRFVLGVERHEVQHRLDYQRGLIPVPPGLCALLGIENPLDAPEGSLQARARDEASAYLAELGRSDDSPLLDLVVLSNFPLNRDTRDLAYTYAALAVYAAMGKALGIDVDAVLGRSISRERFAKLAIELWSRPPNDLREAARRAYLAEFGVELPQVKREGAQENAHYRPKP